MNEEDPNISATKQKIMDVAESMFLEKGADKTSIRQITDQAGVNVASINYYFGSKEALVAEIIHRHMHFMEMRRLPKLESFLADINEGKEVDLLEIINVVIEPFFHYTAANKKRAREMMIFFHRIFVHKEIDIRDRFPQTPPRSLQILVEIIERQTGKKITNILYLFPFTIMAVTNSMLITLTEDSPKHFLQVFPDLPDIKTAQHHAATFIAGGLEKLLE